MQTQSLNEPYILPVQCYTCVHYDNKYVLSVLTIGSDEAGGAEHWSEELAGGAC